MIKDIEIVMEDIKTKVQAALPAMITALNTEKGDSVVTGFETDALGVIKNYNLWSLSNIPPYKVSFFQGIAGNPRVDSNQGGVAITYPLTLTVMLQQTANATLDIKRRLRYTRLLQDVVTKVLVKYDNTVTYQDMDMAMVQKNQNGATYDIVGVLFSITLAS